MRFSTPEVTGWNSQIAASNLENLKIQPLEQTLMQEGGGLEVGLTARYVYFFQFCPNPRRALLVSTAHRLTRLRAYRLLPTPPVSPGNEDTSKNCE
jgi:hypothetical protein